MTLEQLNKTLGDAAKAATKIIADSRRADDAAMAAAKAALDAAEVAKRLHDQAIRAAADVYQLARDAAIAAIADARPWYRRADALAPEQRTFSVRHAAPKAPAQAPKPGPQLVAPAPTVKPAQTKRDPDAGIKAFQRTIRKRRAAWNQGLREAGNR